MAAAWPRENTHNPTPTAAPIPAASNRAQKAYNSFASPRSNPTPDQQAVARINPLSTNIKMPNCDMTLRKFKRKRQNAETLKR